MLIKTACVASPELSQHEITSILLKKDATLHHNIGTTQKFEKKRTDCQFDTKQDQMIKCFFPQSAHGTLASEENQKMKCREWDQGS